MVKVDKFNYRAYFVILDTIEEDKDVLLILGKLFLAINQALLDVQNG